MIKITHRLMIMDCEDEMELRNIGQGELLLLKISYYYNIIPVETFPEMPERAFY